MNICSDSISVIDSERTQSEETPLTKAHPSKTKNDEHDV